MPWKHRRLLGPDLRNGNGSILRIGETIHAVRSGVKRDLGSCGLFFDRIDHYGRNLIIYLTLKRFAGLRLVSEAPDAQSQKTGRFARFFWPVKPAQNCYKMICRRMNDPVDFASSATRSLGRCAAGSRVL